MGGCVQEWVAADGPDGGAGGKSKGGSERDDDDDIPTLGEEGSGARKVRVYGSSACPFCCGR